jgi:predicted patatin/cPLA2 family phospholipase
MFEKTGLVLEGGGFRGIYSAGILDYFLEKDINLPYVIGVSMGACNGTNYISKQKGRNLRVPYNYVRDRRYISIYNLISNGSLFGMDFIFNEIPEKLDIFDKKTFDESNQRFIVVATDCETGKPAYFEKDGKESLFEVLKASSSLPFISNMITIGDCPYLDGGMSDSIPVRKALKDGNEKLVVVLTRPKGYGKKPSNVGLFGKLKYGKYPELLDCINSRYKEYNDTLRYIEELEVANKAFVIRPKDNIDMGRVERSKDKLKKTYDLGYSDAVELESKLLKFLESK